MNINVTIEAFIINTVVGKTLFKYFEIYYFQRKDSNGFV